MAKKAKTARAMKQTDTIKPITPPSFAKELGRSGKVGIKRLFGELVWVRTHQGTATLIGQLWVEADEAVVAVPVVVVAVVPVELPILKIDFSSRLVELTEPSVVVAVK